MKKLLLAAAVTAGLASSAFAADLSRPVYKAPPMAAPVASWTGCYLGAGGGYGMWNQDHQTINATTGLPINNAPEATAGGRGWFGTGQVGCDYQFNQRWVVGAFGDVDFGSLKGTFTPTAPGLVRTGVHGDEKETWSWAVGARLGYLILPQLLGYVSGGYTQAHFDSVALVDGAGAAVGTMSAHNYQGWFLGSGYEYALDFLPGLYWKTEYRFAQYRADKVDIIDTTGALAALENNKKYIQTIRSELVWRFNWGGGPVVAKY